VFYALTCLFLQFSSVFAHLNRLNLIIVKTSVDSSDQLGTMFGLQQTFSATARGIAPSFVSSLFAFSIDHHILGGHFVWLVLFLLSLACLPLTMRVRDLPAPRSR